VLPDPRFLAEHEAAHATSSTARIAVTGCSPVVISEDTSAIARETARRYERFHNRLSDPHRVDAPTDLNGANFSIRLGDLREIGGFNEEYFFQRDDFELGTRLIEAGFRILFAARATAPQRVKDDPNQIINRAKPRALNDLRLAREHPWCVRYLPFGAAMTNDTSRRKWFVLWNSGSVGRAAIKAAHVLFPSSTRLLNLRYAAEYVAVLKESLRSWRAMDDFRAQAQSGLER
jgi:hypothetical protein